MRKRTWKLVSILMAGILLAGCSSGTTPQPADTGAPADKPEASSRYQTAIQANETPDVGGTVDD